MKKIPKQICLPSLKIVFFLIYKLKSTPCVHDFDSMHLQGPQKERLPPKKVLEDLPSEMQIKFLEFFMSPLPQTSFIFAGYS
jgi:hypothetical protein